MSAELIIREYEVFKNEGNALGFFFYHNEALDQNTPEGPFWFTIEGSSIRAGTAEHHVIFAAVTPEIIDAARQRAALMLMEFDGETPTRCTPCYLAEKL